MSNNNVKATVEIGDTKVTFEGPAEFVEAQVARYAVNNASKLQANSGDVSGLPTSGAAVSERQMIEQKQPKGHIETVAVLAFALAQGGTEEFTDEDMRRAYIRAGVRPPKVVGQALRDAKNKADYIEFGATKGTYRLSNHGDRTVRFDLPRQ